MINKDNIDLDYAVFSAECILAKKLISSMEDKK